MYGTIHQCMAPYIVYGVAGVWPMYGMYGACVGCARRVPRRARPGRAPASAGQQRKLINTHTQPCSLVHSRHTLTSTRARTRTARGRLRCVLVPAGGPWSVNPVNRCARRPARRRGAWRCRQRGCGRCGRRGRCCRRRAGRRSGRRRARLQPDVVRVRRRERGAASAARGGSGSAAGSAGALTLLHVSMSQIVISQYSIVPHRGKPQLQCGPRY